MAIARDTTSTPTWQNDFVFTGNTVVRSFSTTGSDRIGWVGIRSAGNDTISSVTWDGVAMTRLGDGQDPTYTGARLFLYYLQLDAAGVGTGSKNIVITNNQDAWTTSIVFAYTGAHQTTAPVLTSIVSAVQPVTLAVTVNDANSWALLICANNNGSNNIAGTGASLLDDDTTFGVGMFDSNAAVSPSSHNMTFSTSVHAGCGAMGAAFAPTGAAAGGQPTSKRWGGVPFMGTGGFKHNFGGNYWRTAAGLLMPQGVLDDYAYHSS